MGSFRVGFATVASLCFAGLVTGDERILAAKLHHLRAGDQQEWSDFPRQAENARLALRFKSKTNPEEWTLRLRQQDVRQTWNVKLNGKEIGRFLGDENDTTLCLPVPAGALADGENVLTIEPAGKANDDIRVGEITLDTRPMRMILNEAAVDITVTDAGHKISTPMPCRITIVNANGSLASTGAASNDYLAVRPGVVYSGTGKARIGLPAGDYTIYAGRGFEYGIDSCRISLKPGDSLIKNLAIRREVPTEGWVSCDTHIHTLTHSGHGDSTIDERMITVAGEGIELAIATDHNSQIDYRAAARKMKVDRFFTPVIGNEVTTGVGHFNVFPLSSDGPVPDFKLKDWRSLFANIEQTKGTKVIILNHPRDLHAAFRPFGPERHLAMTGENLDGWILRANAMEIVNSGAQQTDIMRLVHDWFGLLNGGLHLTPIGSSDSHDVSRYIVGQGRTYIRCPDDRPDEIDVKKAITSFLQGRVMVSCGLLAEMTINGKFGPGDLVPASNEVKVAVRVLGPSWVRADKVELFANGSKIREAVITPSDKAGIKWEGEWKLPQFMHDVHLVAVATGPGVRELYWPIARPYQPTSPIVEHRVIGMSGAAWLDSDGDSKRTCTQEYAVRLLDASWPNKEKVIESLTKYDEAVAIHVARLLQAKGVGLSDPAIREAAAKAGSHVERGFQSFTQAWREGQIARQQRKGP